MFLRKDAVLMAVAGILASAGFAMADTDVLTPALTLDPSVVTAAAQAAPPSGLLMQGLDKVGAADPLQKLGLNIFGWLQTGYTYDHRHHESNSNGLILPVVLNHEHGNHVMVNQLALCIARDVKHDQWDVGGFAEFMYGSDAAFIHSSGMGFNGTDPSQNNPANVFHPIWQFDVTQAWLDVNVPVGNGLVVRTGKWGTFRSYESVNPNLNPFYSHSWIFAVGPCTETGVLGIYKINDQWSVTAGFSRGWDQTFEDSGPEGGSCAIDMPGQVVYTPSKQLSITLNWVVGPETYGDTSHYRTLINPVVRWQATEKLSFAVEGVYLYDGSLQGNAFSTPPVTHAYGDAWGVAGYASYVLCKEATANLRVEEYHDDGYLPYLARQTTNIYEITLGLTISPLPKDPIGKNLIVRPEIRYDMSEDHIFGTGGTTPGSMYKEQLTFGADLIFRF